MPRILVPSDVTILENEYSTGHRRLRLLERLGLWATPPMIHCSYSRNDRNTKRSVLSHSFDKQSTDPMVDLLRRRQESIRKQVVAQNGLWVGTLGGLGSVWYSMRHYDYKTKLIVLPFAAYGGSILGRIGFSTIVGRFSEYRRDKTLGELPAKTYYTG